MNAAFQLTTQATEDLDAIWWIIAEDSQDAAERVEREILSTCHRLARHPRSVSGIRICNCISDLLSITYSKR
jgi:plasmid stabilization system protein ParE